MSAADDREPGTGAGQFLKAGERLLKNSEHVGIKKLFFNAYLTDRRFFLVDEHEKVEGIISREIPRDVITASHLETSDSGDPVLVLVVRTSEEETRTMKVTFVNDDTDRTAEIEEWISLLHGRTVRTKPPVRHRETPVTVIKEEHARTKPAERYPSSPAETTSRPVHLAKQGSPQRYPGEQESETAGIPHEIPADHPDVEELPGIENNHVSRDEDISFCHHCGKKIPAGANFCPYCGTKLHRAR